MSGPIALDPAKLGLPPNLTPAQIQAILEDIIDTIPNLRAVNYMLIASLTALVYDHICTFHAEVTLIWPAKNNSHIKILWLFNRYFVPLVMILDLLTLTIGAYVTLPDDFCRYVYVTSGYCFIASQALVSYLILLRLYILWGRKRWIGGVLALVWFATTVGVLVAVSLSILDFMTQIKFNPILKACVAEHKPLVLGYVWVCNVALETFTFLLFTARAAYHARHKQLTLPLMRLLYTDGFIAALVIFALRVANLMVWLIAPLSLLFLCFFILWAGMSIAISRTFLHLRSVRGKGNASGGWGASTTGDASFDPRQAISQQSFSNTKLERGTRFEIEMQVRSPPPVPQTPSHFYTYGGAVPSAVQPQGSHVRHDWVAHKVQDEDPFDFDYRKETSGYDRDLSVDDMSAGTMDDYDKVSPYSYSYEIDYESQHINPSAPVVNDEERHDGLKHWGKRASLLRALGYGAAQDDPPPLPRQHAYAYGAAQDPPGSTYTPAPLPLSHSPSITRTLSSSRTGRRRGGEIHVEYRWADDHIAHEAEAGGVYQVSAGDVGARSFAL